MPVTDLLSGFVRRGVDAQIRALEDKMPFARALNDLDRSHRCAEVEVHRNKRCE